jgi:hypothetical protein
MKHLKNLEIPAKTIEVVDYKTCDICHERIPEPGSYKLDEIKVQRHEGTSYPEGGWGTDQSFDICPQCWCERFVPWMVSQGAPLIITEWDW